MQIMPEHAARRGSLGQIARLGLLLGCVLLIAACHLDMYDQPKQVPYSESDLFPDKAAARPIDPNIVARNANLDPAVTTGKNGDQFLATNPLPVTPELLAIGKERFTIVCATCHGVNGDAKGAVAASYFRPPPASMYLQRLRTAPDGYLFNVITYGKGQMYPQNFQLTPEQRWAVVAYIRELQKNPPQGVVANPTEVPNPTPRPPGTVQPNQPELPATPAP
jgi:mono/diheme cytochrome c family protein